MLGSELHLRAVVEKGSAPTALLRFLVFNDYHECEIDPCRVRECESPALQYRAFE